MFVRLRLKQGLQEIQDFIFCVPEGCSSKGYASLKQVEPCSWHIEVIPGVSNSGTGRQAHFTDCP